MNFAELKNRHAGKTAYIIGTGPSLDGFDFASVGPDDFVIAIHRAAFVVPDLPCEGFWQVLDDGWAMGVPGLWSECLQAIVDGLAVGLFKDPLNVPPKLKNAASKIPESETIVRFSGGIKGNWKELDLTRDQVAEYGRLFTYAGSGATAVHAAWYMGAASMVLVGLDGGDGYAECLSEWYEKKARGGFGYVEQRKIMEETIRRLGVKAVDYRLERPADENV